MREFYNRYDPKKHKWYGILYKGRDHISAADFNEMQSIIKENFYRFAKSIYKDGSLLSGGEIKKDGNIVEIGGAYILHKGYIVDIPSGKIEITGKGTETIGVAIKEKIGIYPDEPDLLDPVIGTETYGRPSPARLIIEGRWTLDKNVNVEETFYPVYLLIDGNLQIKKEAPEIDGVIEVLARYDKAANGSYIADGMQVVYIGDTEEKHIIEIKEGIAHIQGKEVNFPVSRKIYVDKIFETQKVYSEPHTFLGDRYYQTRYSPIAKINRVIGIKQSTDEITHGLYSGSLDLLPRTPVVEVLEVRQGDKVFKEGVDYIVKGDYIDWSLSGDEPSPGSTYIVVYKYRDILTPKISEDRKSIYIEGLVKNSLFDVDYEFYQKRYDLIAIKDNGDIEIIKGIADPFNPIPPQEPINALPIALVKVEYGKVEVSEFNYRSIKTKELWELKDRLEKIESLVSELFLREEVRNTTPTNKGIFIDPFNNDSMRDEGVEQNAVIENGMLLPSIKWNVYPLTNLEKDITLDIETEETIISQTARSRSRLINQYMYKDPAPAEIKITPSVYRWIADTRVVWRWWWWWWRGSWTTTDAISQGVYQVPRIEIAITGRHFNAYEEVEIRIDDILATTLKADEDGNINGKFLLPSGITNGRKLVKAIGKDSETEAVAVFEAIALRRTIYRTWWWWRWWWDPIAQSFRIENEDRYISSIEVYIEELPKEYLEIAITELTAGFPDSEKVIYKERFDISKLNKGWCKLKLTEPVYLEKDTSYAVILECSDAVARVSTAKMGEYDIENKVHITSQPYEGVLFVSSNSETWSEIQDEDLTFKLNTAIFKKEKEISLGKVNIESTTDILLLAESNTPAKTGIEYFITFLKTGETKKINPYIPLQIKRYTGEVEIKARLFTENTKYTPVLSKDIQLCIGTVEKKSIYVSRAFLTNGDSLQVNLEINEPIGSEIKIYYEENGEWKEMNRDIAEALNVGDGFIDIPFKSSINTTSTRIKIEMNVADETARPIARKLRVIIV